MSRGSRVNSNGRHRLENRIRARYDFESLRLRFDDVEVSIAKVRHPESVLDESFERSDDGNVQEKWEPFWAEAWESALVTADYIAKFDLRGSSLLDLGCGVGVVGTVAAAKGATVVLGDYAPPSLLFAKYNTWPWRETSHVRKINWRFDRLRREQFDWIVGADIVYDQNEWSHILAFARYHLKPNGTLIISDPSRDSGRRFLESAPRFSWLLAAEPELFPIRERLVRVAKLKPR